MKMYFICYFYNIVLKKKIQGLKIYLSEGQNFFDIQLIYEENPEISRHLLVEGDKNVETLRPLILEVLKIFPKLSRLDVEVTEMKKYDEKKKKFEPLDEQKKINAQLSQKDKIYFNLNLKEIWLNVDMVLEERNIKNRIINKNSLHFEILNENNSDNINDNIADYGIYLWGCRDNGNNVNNRETLGEISEGTVEEKTDYYLLYKMHTEIKNNSNKKNILKIGSPEGKKQRSYTIKYKKNNSGIPDFNHKNGNGSKKNLIEMRPIKSDLVKFKEGNKKENKKISIDNKIKCTLIFINFTDYILADEYTYVSQKKRIFNDYFQEFYEEITLDKNRQICLEASNKIIYIQSKIENNKSDNDLNITVSGSNFEGGYPSIGHIPKEKKIIEEKDKAIYEEIKRIDFNEKISNLNPYVFKSNFIRKQDYGDLRDVQNLEIVNKNNEGGDRKESDDNNIIKISDQNLVINIKSDDNLMKKGILVFISIILFIIIIFKALYLLL